jgi:hypothetical protein
MQSYKVLALEQLLNSFTGFQVKCKANGTYYNSISRKKIKGKGRNNKRAHGLLLIID